MLILMIEIDNIFKFEILNLLYGYFNLEIKESFQEFSECNLM
jgi:hypothetical protein